MESKDPLFVECLLEKRVVLPIQSMNEKMEENLLRHVKKQYTGKCIEEGFVHPESVSLHSYSAGKIGPHGIHVVVLFACRVCYPPAGLLVGCTITDVTKAGIHAVCEVLMESKDVIRPLSVYILRDHEFKSDLFDRVKKGDKIQVRLLGSRFELGDTSINAVAEFVE